MDLLHIQKVSNIHVCILLLKQIISDFIHLFLIKYEEFGQILEERNDKVN